MEYSISEVAKMLNVSAHTIRYYDKEGLFPMVKRVNGIRVFEDKDFPWLRILNCLKKTGMPIKKIKEYLDLCSLGDDSLEERYELILEQEKKVLAEISELENNLKELQFKKAYYKKAIEAGTEDVVRNWPNPKATMELDRVPNEEKR